MATDNGGEASPTSPASPASPHKQTTVRRGTVGLWLVLALVLAAAAGVSLWQSRAQQDSADFTLTSTGYEDGVETGPITFSLSDYRGKTVVLDFMAVACASCRIVTDDVLKPLWEEHGGKRADGTDSDLVILSIDTWSDPGSGNTFGGEDDDDLRRLQQETDVPWRHARDTDQVYLKYSAVSLPKLVVIDPEGRIVHERVGLQPLSRVEAAVASAAVGEATPVPVLRLGLAGMAFLAGLAAIFTPCGIGLLPAYLGLLLEQGASAAPTARVRRGIAGGAAAAAGAVALYGSLAAVFWVFGARLRPALPWLGPLLGITLAAFGIAALASGSWAPLARRLRFQTDWQRSGFAGFGAAYALAGFACTGPLFLPLLLAGFLQGPATGLWVFALYTAAVAGVLVFVSAVVAVLGPGAFTRLTRHAVALHRVSAGILVLGGIAIALYAARAEGLV